MQLRKAKQITQIITELPGRLALPKLILDKNVSIKAEELAAARAYIEKFWPKLTRLHAKDDDTLVGLPNPYLVPAFERDHEFDFNEFYYWDSYFMVQGMLDEPHKKLVIGILENLVSLYKRFGIIPNASRTYLMGHSNPPFLTSFIFDVYETYQPDNKWLKSMIEVAKDEYATVWMGKTKPYAHQAFEGLSRYYDINYIHDLAEAESGWDMTPRFNRKCLNYLPIDLNSLLYKYETDFLKAAEILGNKAEAKKWQEVANRRRYTIDRLMWNELRGLYYDYNYIKRSRSSVASLATYYPMWAGMASQKHAARLVKSLRKFEKRGGLATTDAPQVNILVPGATPTQWAYPNGWAPLHFIVAKGLQRYGYHEDARRIALKWIRTNLTWFNKHGVFLEKYNVVSPSKPPAKGIYPSQTGFGWTNSIFERFCREFIDK